MRQFAHHPTALLVSLVLATTALAGCTGPGGLFYNAGGPGDWGAEFLSDREYDSLLVELDYEAGAAPEPSTVNTLRNVLNTYLTKPGGVEIRQAADISGSGSGTKYSFSKIRDMEDDARDHFKKGDRAVMYVMFLDGGSENDNGNSRVLGAAYTGSSVVMFKENIERAANNCNTPFGVGCPSLSTVERAVMTHEVGHLLGLVNNGIDMVTPHEDPNHEHHSNNEDSVMYWKVETGDIVDLFLGDGIPLEFDDDDKADMRAAGGK